MQQQIEQQVHEEAERGIFVPYGFLAELGDCAHSDTAKDVAKDAYADEYSFKVGTRSQVLHAP